MKDGIGAFHFAKYHALGMRDVNAALRHGFYISGGNINSGGGVDRDRNVHLDRASLLFPTTSDCAVERLSLGLGKSQIPDQRRLDDERFI